jgi:hypothetical protein
LLTGERTRRTEEGNAGVFHFRTGGVGERAAGSLALWVEVVVLGAGCRLAAKFCRNRVKAKASPLALAEATSEVAMRTAWSIRTRLGQLFVDGLISRRELRVACWYRQSYERAFCGDLASSFGLLERPRQPHANGIRRQDPQQRQLEAAEFIAHVRRELGTTVGGILDACVIADMPWCELGRRLGRDSKTAKKWATETVRLLARV